MTNKLRLNKNTLREQNERLRALLEYLPTLRLRKQQLQSAVRRVQREQQQCQTARRRLAERVEPWAPMLARMAPRARIHAQVEQVQTETVNVAGLAVPRLLAVVFTPSEPSLLGTPLVTDDVVAALREAARLRAQARVLAEQHERLATELARMSQRINLYDKVLVPKTRRDIRRLRVYLGDQQTAAVCRAKRAKAKVLARRAGAEARADDPIGAAYGDR